MSDTREFDVVIVGGGLVGASLALALTPLSIRVALIEAQAVDAAVESHWDERCIALNDASQQIFQSLGLWSVLSRQAEPIHSTHISEKGRFGVARFTAEEAGLQALGYNIPVRALGQALWSAAQETPTQLLCPAKLKALQVQEDAVTLELEDGGAICARLVVAADGANSPVRKMLGIGAEVRDYAQSAIVTAVQPARAHKNCAYERFTPDGPIALLPKPANRCSLVWTVPSDAVPEMLECSDVAFMQRAEHAFGERLGRFLELGHRTAYPLSRVMSEQLTAPRVLFVGNAAQSLHPVAAQGFNLGLRDVASVAECLAGCAADADPGAPELLQTYERQRVRDRDTVSGFTDHLVRLFSNRVPGLRGLRHLGLLALDLAPPLKRAVMWQNLGYSGVTPRLAMKTGSGHRLPS